jgi:hypothetical protein
MKTQTFIRYYRFSLTGLLLGVFVTTLVVFAEQPTGETDTATTTPSVHTEPEPTLVEEEGATSTTPVATPTEPVATTTEPVTATTTEETVSTEPATTTASTTEEGTTATSTEVTSTPPPEPEAPLAPEQAPSTTDEPVPPFLTPDECHTVYEDYGYRNPGACMRQGGRR